MDQSVEGEGWRCLWPLACELGEAAMWDAASGRLWFVDIEGRQIHRFTPATDERFSWTAPCRVGAIGLRARGGLVAACEEGFVLVDPDSGNWTPIGDPEPHLPTNRFNDGKVDAAGAFWAGSMDDRKTSRQGTLYRLAPDGSWTVADTGYRITNGPAFSPDGATLYENDTPLGVTYAFDVADGVLANRRVFAEWRDMPGYPDGMTTDAEGYLWIAFWGGSCVRRVSPDGRVVAEHALPTAHVTSMAFAGDALDRLFVTTARQALTDAELAAQPLAGGLFEINPGVRGMAGGVFAG